MGKKERKKYRKCLYSQWTQHFVMSQKALTPTSRCARLPKDRPSKTCGRSQQNINPTRKVSGFFLCKAVNTGLNMLLSGERACVYGGWFIVTGCVNKSTRKNVNKQHVRNWKIIPFIHFWPFYSQGWTAVMKENKHILMWEACNLECMATRDLINSEQPQNIRWDGRLFF